MEAQPVRRPFTWAEAEAVSSATGLQRLTLDYLAAHHTISLATSGSNGLWATTVFYASLGFTLYFLSEPKTQHVQNILQAPEMAGTVNEDYQDWRQIKGIQLAGTCEEVVDPQESAAALEAYVDKYPFVAAFLGPERSLQGMQVAGRPLDVRLYAVRPTRLLYLDNERGFSNREEISLDVQA
jgi:uncharacterized protein